MQFGGCSSEGAVWRVQIGGCKFGRVQVQLEGRKGASMEGCKFGRVQVWRVQFGGCKLQLGSLEGAVWRVQF